MNVKIECTNELNTNWVGLFNFNPMQVIIPFSSLPLLDPIVVFIKQIKLVENTLQNIGQQFFDTKYTFNLG
jgi:hypothetical protein